MNKEYVVFYWGQITYDAMGYTPYRTYASLKDVSKDLTPLKDVSFEEASYGNPFYEKTFRDGALTLVKRAHPPIIQEVINVDSVLKSIVY